MNHIVDTKQVCGSGSAFFFRSWIRISFKVQIHELLEGQNGAVLGCERVEARNGALEGLQTSDLRFASL